MPAKIKQALNLHDASALKFVVPLSVILLFILSILVRKSLIYFENADYSIFSSWYNFAQQHGIHTFKYGFSDGFSNYNSTYNYFLYILTLLPLSKIVAIKGLMLVFDLVLAASFYYIVKYFRPKGYSAVFAALAALYIPSVLFTGVLWGQFDQFYVAFIIFTLGAALRSNSKLAWIFFGIALSIKFQAIFFLPVMGLLVFKKIYWHDALWGALAFLAISLPPVFAGRSLLSILDIYPAQARLFNESLTLNAPNVYQWFPNSAFHTLNGAGICFGVAIAIAIVLYGIIRKKFNNKDILVASTLMLTVVPFLLPAMHERYFFPASIASILMAIILRRTIDIVIAVGLQVVIILSYCPFLFSTTPIPFAILTFMMLVIVILLSIDYMKSDALVPAVEKRLKSPQPKL